MYTNNKKEWVLITFSLFMLVLAIMSCLIIFSWLPNLQSNIKHEELVGTGIHTEATIIDYKYTETVMNKHYYTLYYTFTDEHSNPHGGKTSPAYTYEEVYNLINSDSKIEIVYNPTTFDSIQATYKSSDDPILWILPLVAIIFTVGFSLPFIIEFRSYRNSKKLKNEGFDEAENDYYTGAVNVNSTTSSNDGSIFTDDTIFCLSKEDFKKSFTNIEQVKDFAKNYLDDELKSGISMEEYKQEELAVEKEIEKAETLLFNEKYKFNVNNSSSNNDDIYKYEKPFK